MLDLLGAWSAADRKVGFLLRFLFLSYSAPLSVRA
jgi:hypothetical protein